MKKLKAPRRRNHVAAVLGRGPYRNRRITPKVVYSRKPKHKKEQL